MSYIDVTPEPAASAARATANTAPTWSSWASASETALRSSASSSDDSIVTPAFQTYLQDINPRMKSLSALAEEQGVALGSAVQIGIDGDHAATMDLQGAQSGAQTYAPVVTRPINEN
ncbi:MAG: hypothetical protein ACRDO7_09140 [Nocardioidaceae bacterium]